MVDKYMPSRRVRSTARRTLIEQDRLIQEELVITFRDTAEDGISQFERVTAQWAHKVKFRPVLTVRRSWGPPFSWMPGSLTVVPPIPTKGAWVVMVLSAAR